MTIDEATDPIRTGVGRAIRAARVDAGMSMRMLASRSGVSQPFISAVERGLSTPSISTLYRIAEELGTDPATLLPVHHADEISVIRADEGDLVPSSDRPGSAVGRVLLRDEIRQIEIYEYVATSDDDFDVWFQHPGDVMLHLIEGQLQVEFQDRGDVILNAGDCVVHPGSVAHKWTVKGDCAARIFLTIVRSRA